ncbi:hypothetical protein ACFFQF_05680 [Haladaptatus pallidirubidus]|uniref:PH domain-containing protein n=1 Tax=Haladaptatus pallidirubidus TaxID=1008152 RepID=A0AAV3ULR5_9EURY|nr:hypothetical protein [Haladaptatus pallidirubidus]
MIELRFREAQRFRQGWLWALLIFSTIPVGLLVFVVTINEADGFTRDALTTLATVTVALIAPLILFHRAELVTEVREDGLYCKFFPFHLRFRRIPFSEITRFERVSYSPMRDYGGWGIRFGLSLSLRGISWDEKGAAYIVSGNEGVRIERKGERPLLVGSQRADELRRAIADARR